MLEQTKQRLGIELCSCPGVVAGLSFLFPLLVACRWPVLMFLFVQPGPGCPVAGRGYLGARHGVGKARAGGPRPAGGHAAANDHRHRASALHNPVNLCFVLLKNVLMRRSSIYRERELHYETAFLDMILVDRIVSGYATLGKANFLYISQFSV